jgi:hypothetical protein
MNLEQDQQNHIFSNEQITIFVGLRDTLKKIHTRLISEGYTIKNNAIIPPQKTISKKQCML